MGLIQPASKAAMQRTIAGSGGVTVKQAVQDAVRDAALAPWQEDLVARGQVADPRDQTNHAAARLRELIDAYVEMAHNPPVAPGLIHDLPTLCPIPQCGVLLVGLGYTVMIGKDGRPMIWIAGICPRCMDKRVVVWDPMPGGQEVHDAKRMAETRDVVEGWVADLMGAEVACG